MTAYESVIGLEVHVQLKTNSKIFCSCPTGFGETANSQICPVCCGYPGVLPVLNKKAVDELVRAALAVGCRINPRSVFARKQYFYPDLPKNYQISQHDLPLAVNGHLDIPQKSGEKKTVRIQRIHLEEDAGKLLHAVGSRALDYSLVDLNRTGVPLMEIVSEPDIRSPEEASDYLDTLRTLLRYVGASECDMEKGSMRCDANVSIRPVGQTSLGTRAEVKNMNSLRSVRDAVAHEIARQIQVVESGGRVVQETRLWNQDEGATHSMRSKEEAHDYRYFPDPDLVPVELSADWIETLRRSLPELPEARCARYERDLGLSAYDAAVLTAEKTLADFFETALNRFEAPARREAAKPLSNWLTTELLGRLNAQRKTLDESPVSSVQLADLVKLILNGVINSKAAKVVFDHMFTEGGDPETIVKAKGLVQVDDEAEIGRWVDDVVAVNPKIVADIQGGKAGAVGSLVGQVMKRSGGRANPQTVQNLLKKKLGLP
ncbi:MAG: Asp-tRNA(Asn)/Glu-tRNA(Gln) amidotransferase subunit GatB [Elusimicrobia bacterium]|nr:Asp-tRNA(Asn)/Glu-tRNA(Gln) amidotransferase subunit GatB [Elusimicrobiota bacterium]